MTFIPLVTLRYVLASWYGEGKDRPVKPLQAFAVQLRCPIARRREMVDKISGSLLTNGSSHELGNI